MKPMDQSSGDPAALKGTRPWTLPFPEENWQRTPAAVQLFIAGQQKTIEVLTKRLDELEARLNRNSSNSDQPSSSDSPYRKATSASKEKRKASGKKGRKGYR
jgi:transposase